MTFEETLAWVKNEVEKDLAMFFEKKRSDALKIDPHCVDLVDQIADVTMRGGKRIRAYVCWLGFKTVYSLHPPAGRAGFTVNSRKEKPTHDNSDHLSRELGKAMVALELFHSFALIHDDIMDEDDTRRGGPTVHEHFRTNHESRITNHAPNAKQYGVSMAILAGDLALVWADELMRSIRYQVSGVKSKTSKKATRGTRDPVALYQEMKQEVIYGQTLDVFSKVEPFLKGSTLTQSKISELKTAWYSVIRPLQIGASLAGASTPTLELLATFGLPVGLLFQLKDDVLDDTTTPTAFKKAVQPLRARAARALGALHLSQEIHRQCESLVRFVVERTF